MATQSEVDQSDIITEAKESCEMSPDEQRPTEKETTKEAELVSEQDAPLTKEHFSEQMQQLAERARAAGLNPLRAMVQTYAKQGMAIFEGLLDSLENAGSSKKKE